MTTIIERLSPNFDERAADVPLTLVVIHYTGMKSGAEALERLCDPSSKVSAHYMIEEDGRIFHLVKEEKRAWHAGKSFWRGFTDINSASIGIELVHPGHAHGYRGFPSAQISVLKTLLGDLCRRHNLQPSTALLGHSDIAPGRKEDPGELFPWHELAMSGFGSWPKPEQADYQPATEIEVQAWLRHIGYDCPEHGEYDRAMRAALLAFQRHYEPNNLTGTPEPETIARLRALVRQGGIT